MIHATVMPDVSSFSSRGMFFLDAFSLVYLFCLIFMVTTDAAHLSEKNSLQHKTARNDEARTAKCCFGMRVTAALDKLSISPASCCALFPRPRATFHRIEAPSPFGRTRTRANRTGAVTDPIGVASSSGDQQRPLSRTHATKDLQSSAMECRRPSASQRWIDAIGPRGGSSASIEPIRLCI